ncbi:aldehyde dehydrogenase family protein [Rubrobacter taiwanensis]|jgi:acyl-CoA reductase-like NAD-dependent aldehyde dehydrogenase|uniref:Aldehyde dehydrogenase family protein n=1 Tax=Rubrobacter taiwanensis TaxID=185139 RepID=A0A4R1BJB7_9ACTN|nr:aldehyde dehydrogenase family protein [Rubrobacter taiwanensis]TCJ17389.1 aldehyde dehydrogenase family protein [Rubrobacter taiwanensis]
MQTKARTRDLLIGGEWTRANEYISVRSPYNDSEVGRVGKADPEHVERALERAHEALSSPIPAYRRAEILERAARSVEENAEDLARTIALEAGKPMKAARLEVSRAISTFTFAAVEARQLAGELVPMESSPAGAGKLAFTLRLPIGVVGAITPFNFPVNLVAHKLAPAVAAGCPVVLKPASATPLSGFNLAEILLNAGLPEAYISVVPGSGSEVGGMLVEDERVRYITFTGSGTVGWGIQERAKKKKVALELGNSTPLVVHSDADLEAAASAIATHAYSYAGQSCISIQRVIVQRDVHDELLERLVPKVEALKVGDPLDEETDVGPLITPEDRERVMDWIAEARRDGASVLTGGELENGILRPTVIDGVRPEMKVSCEEVFGPVASVLTYQDLKEAIELANSTNYGLQAGIFTRDLGNALAAAQAMQFGGVLVNEAPTFRADQMPYGGTKDSGNTREGPHYAVREMTEERVIVLNHPG